MSNSYYQDQYSEMSSNRYSDDYGRKDPCKGPCKDHHKDDCKDPCKDHHKDDCKDPCKDHHKDDCKDPCRDHHKDDCKDLSKRIFAQFASQAPQEVNTGDETAVKIPKQILSNTDCITLATPTTIRLEAGIYSVAYHVTIKNRKDDDETFTSFLTLNSKTIRYSESSVSLDEKDDDNTGSLSKTIFIEVRQRSFLQLLTKEEGEQAKYILTNASIAIEKLC